MTTPEHEQLRNENDRLRLTLEHVNRRLAAYERANDIATGWLVGKVVNTISQPVLVQSGNIIYGINLTDKNVIMDERYIFPFVLDGRFDRRCSTHHIILNCERAIPIVMAEGTSITPQNELPLFVVTQILNTFPGGFGKIP
jgi:hypothetical protein